MSEFVTYGEFERWRTRAAYLYVGLAVICALSIALAVRVVTDSSKERQRTAAFQACQRGNVVRAYEVISAGWYVTRPQERQESALALFPILNCIPLTEGGLATPASAKFAEDYISALALRMGEHDWKR